MANSPGIQDLGQVAVCVRDLDRAIEFYRDVLGLPFLFSAPPDLAFFHAGEVRLMLTLGEQVGFNGTSTLYFRVASAAQALDAIRDRCEVVDEAHMIAKMPDHELWMAFFKDSEGNSMSFMEERRE